MPTCPLTFPAPVPRASWDTSPLTSDRQRLARGRRFSGRKAEGLEKALQQHLTLQSQTAEFHLTAERTHGHTKPHGSPAPGTANANCTVASLLVQCFKPVLFGPRSPSPFRGRTCHGTLQPEQQNFGVVLSQGSPGIQKTKASYLMWSKSWRRLRCSGGTGENQHPNAFWGGGNSRIPRLMFLE